MQNEEKSNCTRRLTWWRMREWVRWSRVFLPRFRPHGFVIGSPRLRVLALFAPAGLKEAFYRVSAPAKSLDVLAGAVTYSTADLQQTAERFSQYGVHFLSPDEIAGQMPLYPKPLPPGPGR